MERPGQGFDRCTLSPTMPSEPGRGIVALRPSTPADAPVVFRIESDPKGRRMAAFGGEDSPSLGAFQSRWERMIRDRSVRVRTVLWNGEIVGWVGQFELFQKPSVAYWIDREFWGRGIATRALLALLAESPVRPMYARVAKDNVASRRVLEKCGFTLSGEEKGFARYRGVEVEELIYQLRAPRGSPNRHPLRAPRSRAPLGARGPPFLTPVALAADPGTSVLGHPPGWSGSALKEPASR